MGLRRDAREAAVQFLYQLDTHKPADVEKALEEFWRQNDAKQNVRDFANELRWNQAYYRLAQGF